MFWKKDAPIVPVFEKSEAFYKCKKRIDDAAIITEVNLMKCSGYRTPCGLSLLPTQTTFKSVSVEMPTIEAELLYSMARRKCWDLERIENNKILSEL